MISPSAPLNVMMMMIIIIVAGLPPASTALAAFCASYEESRSQRRAVIRGWMWPQLHGSLAQGVSPQYHRGSPSFGGHRGALFATCKGKLPSDLCISPGSASTWRHDHSSRSSNLREEPSEPLLCRAGRSESTVRARTWAWRPRCEGQFCGTEPLTCGPCWDLRSMLGGQCQN